ncbi:MAG: primosomal protein N' [Desulfovibrio sp.]|jgi:primosomal protein N' (replication factor Y)|nr:primosomal protein N' [Desulfovibrio sp.]
MTVAPAVAQVAVLSPPFATLSYSLPEYLPSSAFQPGQRVIVPLGRGLRVGLILGQDVRTRDAARDARGSSDEKQRKDFVLKPVLWPLEREALIPAFYLDLAAQLALRQTESPGRILGSMLPAGLRNAQVRIRFFGEGPPREIGPWELAGLHADELSRLGRLWTVGQAEIRRPGDNRLDRELCSLALDPPWPIRPAAKAQRALLEYLHERGEVSRRALGKSLGKGAASLVFLLAGRGIIRVRPADDPAPEGYSFPAISPSDGVLCLTPHQRTVFEPLLQAVRSGRAETRLLFGITGSGKTAVYMELARAVLTMGKSVLLLAPEVALVLKLWGDARASLPGARADLFHGYLSAAAKEAVFCDLAASGHSTRLLVGTRSALLLPLDNVGLIILDEEHDASFKQDEGLTYQAKEVAWYRAEKQGALLLLGSATPDVKSYHAAMAGKIPLHLLTERVGGGRLPEVSVAALSRQGTDGSPLAPESLEALLTVAEKNEQAVILLNRRGYAPLMYCLGCSAVAKCPHCDIGLAYHKGRERLLCHYCGYSVPFPSPCAVCRGMHFLPMGEGTEKLEERLGTLLPPGTGILRLDRDSTRRPGRMEEILGAFARKEASVLVGTQMLSKGHHFPDVTLAIVADADIGLNLPDYRAAERTFQLLLQSAGRAGRGEKPGRVIIQSRDPAHYCWEYVRRADYHGFYERELALRKRRSYPPFTRLALIRVSFAENDADGQEEVAALGAFLRRRAGDLGLVLLGPAPAPLPFLKGRHRWHCLAKGQEWRALRALYNAALDYSGKDRLRLRLDLDPVNML